MSEQERIQALEQIVRSLVQQVETLRAEVQALSLTSARKPASRPVRFHAAEPYVAPSEREPEVQLEVALVSAEVVAEPPSQSRDAPPRTRSATTDRRTGLRREMDVEALVGRYGTIALASLTILMGTGVFLRWAVAHIQLGPETRVLLGALWAAIIAGVAQWMRARGVRRYGNVLLALALAVVHVDAWAAGPRLHVISTGTALAIAAIASELIAGIALREGEQTLFVVGVGGALLAPFVTADAAGDVRMLMLFGWIVIVGGLYALSSRPWTFARRMLGLAALAYVVAGFIQLTMLPRAAVLSERLAPAALGIALAWAALAVCKPQFRRALAIAFLCSAIVGALDITNHSGVLIVATVAATITVTSYLALRIPALDTPSQSLIGAVFIPIVALGLALTALPNSYVLIGALLCAAWCVGAFAMALTTQRFPERGAHLVVAGFTSAAIPVLMFDGRGVPCIIALAVHAVLFSLILRRERTALLAVPILTSLVGATAWAEVLLSARPEYRYTPFLSDYSAAALCCVLAWWAFGWIASRAELRDAGPLRPSERAVVASLGGVAAFLWIREELAWAVSLDAATFALIVYYALAGVGTIFLGRQREMAGARKLGLALAVYAALKAIVQASDVQNLVLRVGCYLLVGCFLLGVAYWYRATSPGEPEPDSPRQAGSTEPAAAAAAPPS